MTAQQYRDRRTAGQCVQCCKQAEVRNGRAMALCASCGQKRRDYDKLYGKPELEDEAILYPAEPKRAPYKADLPPMPPVPEKCPRCQGFVLTQHQETRCLSCGWYLHPEPMPLEELDTRKIGAQLPVVQG